MAVALSAAIGLTRLKGTRDAAPVAASLAARTDSSPGSAARESGSPEERHDRSRLPSREDLARLMEASARHPSPPSAPEPEPIRLGLAAEDLAPVPLAERPTAEDLARINAEAAEERARAPRPEPPDPNLLIGLLAAVKQVKENPALRAGIINAYLDAIRGLDEHEESEARQQLEEAESSL